MNGRVPFEWDEDGTADRAALRQGTVLPVGVILLPFPPESAASEVGTAPTAGTLWYSLELPTAAVTASEERALMLHFEAVYGDTSVWLDGTLIGRSTVSYTRRSFDLGSSLDPEITHRVVVEVNVDHRDLSRPRGKQDWKDAPHGIWYGRSSGIWRDVWVEAVPEVHISHLAVQSNIAHQTATASVQLSRPAPDGATVEITLGDGSTLHGSAASSAVGASVTIPMVIPGLANIHDHQALLWSPDNPVLLDVVVELRVGATTLDRVESYAGIREAAISGDAFLLNGRPTYVNSVLEQYYWPDSHYTAPSDDDRRREVELIRELGFTAVRVHQVSPDPRFLYWCDRLGVLVWAELPSAYRFDAASVDYLLAEWRGIVATSSAHPSVVTWVPINESWGVPDLVDRADQRALVLMLVSLARALDASRPVISNDGWEHVDSDILGFHDYAQTGSELLSRFSDRSWIAFHAASFGVAGRKAVVSTAQSVERPVMLSEFGGVTFDVSDTAGAWGYGTVEDEAHLESKLRELVSAARNIPRLAGTCYTQLTDTLQEANGLLDERRRPKVAMETLREIFAE
jgi:hypothetical protein